VDHDDRTADIGMLGSDTDNPEPGRDTRRTDPTQPPQPVRATR
jgi:hypothetical protein